MQVDILRFSGSLNAKDLRVIQLIIICDMGTFNTNKINSGSINTLDSAFTYTTTKRNEVYTSYKLN
jgi:hypothetical protein